MRIIIAEDDPTSRKILEVTLRQWGYEIEVASDGQEAWALLQEDDAPTLVILDWMMPGLDGLEVCRRVRRRQTDYPPYIILLTALVQKANIVQGLEAGADDYITKPFNSDELRARVEVGRRMVTLQAKLAERVAELQGALDHIETLQGLLPICMHCHKIRDDGEAWHGLEQYVEQHSAATFSHSLCPDCLKEHYPEVADEVLGRSKAQE